MTPCIVVDGLITQEEVELLEKTKRLLEGFPNIKFASSEGKETFLSCHMLTRAVAEVIPRLAVVDGYFGRVGVEHSWILTPESDNAPEGNILDVYPSGQISGPMLVWNGFRSPWRPLYMRENLPLEKRFSERQLDYVKIVMKGRAELLGIIPKAAA